MPNWLVMSASAGTNGGLVMSPSWTRYAPPMSGQNPINFIEANMQFLARDSYTWSLFYVRVIANSLTNTTTVRTRINGVNGNQSVSIGAGLTGAFTDDVNSDSLVNGDLFCVQGVTLAGGTSITFSIFASQLRASTGVPVLGRAMDDAPVTFGLTRYDTVAGEPQMVSTEGNCQYTWRVAATLSNLRASIGENTLNGATTIRTRINGVNGAQSVSVGAGVTGAFEDAVNTDAVAVADAVNYQAVTGGTAGSLNPVNIHLKSTSTGRQAISSRAGLGTDNSGTTFYRALEGSIPASSVESRSQAAARRAFIARNLFVRCTANTLNGATTINTRKNGADANLTLTIGAGATGAFEDTANQDSFVAADLVNYVIARGGGAGQSSVGITGLEERQSPPGQISNLPVRLKGAGAI